MYFCALNTVKAPQRARVRARADGGQAAGKGIWIEQRVKRSHDKHSAQLSSPLSLQHVRVVVVAPKHETNVGAIARACDNFECPNIHIVQPRCDVTSDEVLAIACGSDLVRTIVVHDSISAALSDTVAAVAFTRRPGSARPTCTSFRSLQSTLPALIPFSHPAAPVALVFGREESGLNAEEIMHCSHFCEIPSGRTQPSLNLSHAVAVTLAQAFHEVTTAVPPASSELEPAQASAAAHSDPGDRLSTAAHEARNRKKWGTPEPLARPESVQALMERCRRIVGVLNLSEELTRGRSNNGRKITQLGHLKVLLAQASPTEAQIRAMHLLAKRLETQLGLEEEVVTVKQELQEEPQEEASLTR